MIEHLEWDSNFFGFKVGKIIIGPNQTIYKVQPSDYRLIYCFIERQNRIANASAVESSFKLVDTKVVFIKNLELLKTPIKSEIHIASYTNMFLPYKDKIISIGIQSGIYSRFKRDRGFPEGTFEKLYTVWMEKSLSHEIADEVFLVYNSSLEIFGVATIVAKKDYAEIGIIAVDEHARGAGLGKLLLQKIEAYCIAMNINKIKVATQLDNKEACFFYKANGYEVESEVNIYHHWI